MKKQYRDPELKLVLFNDVIITSGGPNPVIEEEDFEIIQDGQ